MLCVPPAEPVCGSCAGSHVMLTLEKWPHINHTPPRALGGFYQSAGSKADSDPKATPDVPIWSRITTSANIANLRVEYGVRGTPGRRARDTLRTWVRSGVFHNTTGETSPMRDQMGHHLSENDLRLPQGRKASRKDKWSCSVAQTAEHGRMRPDPSGRKPSRFPNKTPRAGPGPSH